jgi:putative oxidoreductase
MRWLFGTSAGWSGLVLRVGLGIVMFPHGMQKVSAWFGGHGFAATYQQFTQVMHFPAAIAVLVILAESLGSIGLIVGCLTRIAAFGILCNMIGAIALVHWRNGFFMNWFGQRSGEGFEYHLLAITISLALVIVGAGNWSIDKSIASLARRRESPASLPTSSG